jgi:two-component system, NtrC family, sensor kinase
MKRRGTSSQPVKGQRQRTQPKARKAPTAPASIADRDELLDQRTRERDEALEQLAATSEVLQIIGSSSGELKPVFQTMLEKATDLCGATFGNMYLRKGDAFELAATYNSPPALVEERARAPYITKTGSPPDRMLRTKSAVHIIDLASSEFYLSRDPRAVAGVELGGVRTLLLVPMLKDAEVVGHFAIFRQEVRPFTERQIELVKNFAAQAVIAIENTWLLNELRESLQQQTATADVLKVISSSPGELNPVFEAMLENATKLCKATYGTMHLREGDGYRTAARQGHSPNIAKQRWWTGEHFKPRSDVPLARCARTRAPVHVADTRQEPAYLEGDSWMVAGVDAAGIRSMVVVPMLKGDELVGAISIYRTEVRPFSDNQIDLVQNFAAQAVIAIENARLLNELRESLQQQTATADVLKVISSSPGELEPVFRTMLENATNLCGAQFGHMYLRRGDAFELAAAHNTPPDFAEERKRTPYRFDRGKTPTNQMVRTKSVIHVADLRLHESYLSRDPRAVAAVELGGVRSVILVPMLNEGEVVGGFAIYRQEVRPFTDKQIELVQNFAAQAVIAIENARLLNELRQRTGDLSEALEQQTATSDVLKIISSSPGELEPVFNTILANATRICEAKFGLLYRSERDVFRTVAMHGAPQSYFEERQRDPIVRPAPATALGRAVATKQPVQIADILKGPEYLNVPAGYTGTQFAMLSGARTVLGVPMLKDNELVGVITIFRQEVRPFTDKQIELVKNFAAQAVIAIENTRLLNELRESLQQQTATADVLRVISRSTFDLQTVLDTLIESAARLCAADRGSVFLREEHLFRLRANYGFSSGEMQRYALEHPLKVDRGSITGRVALEGRAIHIPDVLADPEYKATGYQKTFGYRTNLGVPLLREGTTIGVFTLTRDEVNPFTEKQIELATIFADQAVIAIENVRLFDEVQARTHELTASLENLRNTQDRLVQTQKLASLGQLTAGIAHEMKNPLNFVNNFSVVSSELVDELQQCLKNMSLNDAERGEITELMHTLRGNLNKVVQHGKRADAIVKSMLQHSREGSGEHWPVDINALVEESLNLAWHGTRAEKQGIEIALRQSLDPSAGKVDVFPQDIRRALLNVISNGFYAAMKRRAATNDGDYEPVLTASTKNLGDRVEIRIRDNGTGIASDVKEKMFNPFFTTKPTGEGTGLGLSISHDIIVKQHTGTIEVDTQPGEFTEIRIVLPRAPAFL